KALLDAGKITAFYDVRTPKERALAALPNTKLLDDAVLAEIEQLPRDTVLAFHCHHGGRSRGAAEHVLKMGFKQVYNLAGGIEAGAAPERAGGARRPRRLPPAAATGDPASLRCARRQRDLRAAPRKAGRRSRKARRGPRPERTAETADSPTRPARHDPAGPRG